MIKRSDMPLTRAGSHPRGLTLYGITTLLRSKEIACPEWGRRSCLGLERLRGRRGQGFATPGVKRVVDHQAMTQHFVVVGKIRRKSERDRVKPLAFRSEIAPRRVGTAHDRGDAIQSRVLDIEDADDRIEGAAITYVPEFGALDVIWNTAGLIRNCGDLIRWHIDEFGTRIDEARDQPRTGNAIDLWVFAGNPFIVRPATEFSSCGQFHFLPGRDTSLKICCLDAGGTQHLRYVLAHLTTKAAIGHYDATDGPLPRPAVDFSRGMTGRADDQPIIGVEGVLATNIHQHRRRGGAEVRVEFSCGYRKKIPVHG